MLPKILSISTCQLSMCLADIFFGDTSGLINSGELFLGSGEWGVWYDARERVDLFKDDTAKSHWRSEILSLREREGRELLTRSR